MAKTIIEIQDFKYNYKVYDKNKNIIEKVFDNLHDAIKYTKHGSKWTEIPILSYTLKKEINGGRYIILDYFGVPVHETDICSIKIQYKNSNYLKELAKRQIILEKILFNKHKNKKIKFAYKKNKKYSSILQEYSLNNHITFFRKVKTFNEMKKSCLDYNEYGNIIRAKRSHKNLPNSYDDICCNVFKQQKSWKHNSKKTRQWK